jgi:hypothetical protein
VVSSGNARAVVGSAPPEAQAFLAHATREAFLSGINLIFVIAGITAIVGAVSSLALIRARDLNVEAVGETESAHVEEPAEEAALAA